jgi:hypothetical protein
MGAWQFIAAEAGANVEINHSIMWDATLSASPATGFPKIYKMEQDGIVDQAIGPHNQAGGMAG